MPDPVGGGISGTVDSERQFARLIDGIRDCAIYMLDRSGNVVSWNPGAERIICTRLSVHDTGGSPHTGECSLTNGATDDPAVPCLMAARFENRLLAALPRAGRQKFLANCDHVALTLQATLALAGEQIRHVYFPTAGLISLTVKLDNGAQLEVGVIGNEGMLGSTLTLGVSIWPQHAIVQVAGTALRMSVAAFRRHCRHDSKLRERVAHHVFVSMRQLAQMSACSRYHQVEARLARRLLISRDRVGANEFHLTHEFLAATLGVRRVGITQAARALQARGLISYHRGDITIIDGAGLEIRSCECYRRANLIYAQVLGSPHSIAHGGANVR